MSISHHKNLTMADFTGTVTVFNSQASTTTIAATDIARPSDWNLGHDQLFTLSGNTTQNNTASGVNVIFSGAGAYLSIGGSSDTLAFSTPPHVSSMEFPPEGPNGTAVISTNSGSVSYALAFNMKQPISASFLRVAVSMATNSTTLATTGASMSASVELRGTWNAVIYSLATGASSKSLTSVASGSAGWTFRNSISVAANGTQYSVTQQVSYPAEGGQVNTSTQYSISNTNYSFTTQQIATNFSGNRFLDIPFAASLPAGAYWLILGQTTSLATNSTGISNASACQVMYSNAFVATQINSSVGVMGSTNLTSGGLLGAGSFSTAGGGTTAALPISAISSSASHPQVYFQLLRSA